MHSYSQGAEILGELEKALHAKVLINSKRIDKYILQVKYNPGEVIGPDDTIQESCNKLLGTINELINCEWYAEVDEEQIVVKLLEAILSHILIDKILQIYLEEYIAQGLKYDTGVCCVILGILTRDASSRAVVDLLLSGQILGLILGRYFDPHTSIRTVSRIEELIKTLSLLKSSVLERLVSERKFHFYDGARNSKTSEIRFLDFVVLLMPYIMENGLNFPAQYYVLSELDFSVEGGDILEVVLRIQFYVKLAETIIDFGSSTPIFDNIRGILTYLVKLYYNRNEDRIIKAFFVPDIVRLMAVLSYSTVEQVSSFNTKCVQEFQFFKSYNLMFDEDSDVLLLSTYNPELIPSEELEDIIQGKPLLNSEFFGIVLHFVSDQKLFSKLAPLLTNARISALPSDMLYRLLLSMTKYKYSVDFLLTKLPNITASFLVTTQEPLTNPEIWRMRRDSLLNLLKGYELGIWHDKIVKALEITQSGKKIGDYEAKVSLIDETV